MGSLTGCIKKAGVHMHPEDKAALLAQAKELRAAGVATAEAARQAISKHLGVVSGLREKADKAWEGAQVKGDSLHHSEALAAQQRTDSPQFKKWFGDSGAYDPNDPNILRQSPAGSKLSAEVSDLRQRLVLVARAALADSRDSESVAGKAQKDGFSASTKGRADLLETDAVGAEEDGLVSVPALTAMFAEMRRAVLDDPKVLGTIVGSLPVDVVNNLAGSETAAERLLRDHPMFKDGSAFDADLAVASAFGDTADPVLLLVREAAVQAAELASVPLGPAGEAKEGDAAALASQGNGLGQGGLQQGPNATFNPTTNTIALLQSANLSSFLHESGHFFLEVLSDLAAQPTAPQQVKDDWAATLKWFGIKGDKASAPVAPLPVDSVPSRLELHAKAISDLAVSQTAGAQPDGVISAEPFISVFGEVAGAVSDPQVLNAVVAALPVDVMNVLGAKKAAAKKVLHDGAMLQNAFAVSRDGDVSIAIDKAQQLSTLVGVVASVTAKVARAPNVRGASKEANAAMATGQVEHDSSALVGQQDRPADEVWRAMSLDEKRPYHERWAESFEAYLLEGRAPSLELRGPFQRFRSFLLQVYKSLKDFATGRNLQINAEVRAVFDRLLATDEQIAQAEEQARYEAVYRTAEEAGMDEHEWAVYQEMHKQGTDAAIDTMQARSMADMKWAAAAHSKALRKAQAAVKALRDDMKAKVTEEVMASPLEQAREYIAETRQSTPEQKAELAAWKQARVAEVERSIAAQTAALFEANPEVKGLEKAQLASKNKKLIANQAENAALQWEKDNPRPQPKLPPVEMDMIAERFGFSSGDELAKTMVEQPAAKDLIEAMTEQRLLAEHGDLITPQAIQKAANEAVHNEARARFVATELATMQAAMAQTEQTGVNKAGKPVSTNVLIRAAKEFAKAIVARRKISDLKPGRYTAAERRAGAAVKKAMAAGKTAEAVQAQRDKLLNLYAAKETMSALDEVERAVAYLKKVQDSKTVDADYREQIRGILEKIDLRQISQTEIEKRKSLAEWLKQQEALGLDPQLPQKLIDNSRLTSYKDMPLEEFRGIVDAVRQIEHLGRLKNRLLTAKDQREFGAARDAIAASIESFAGNRQANTRTPTTNAGRWFQAVKNFAAAHIKTATLARIMDGGKDGGLVWEYIIRPANERGDMETRMRAEATEALHLIVDPWLSQGKTGGKGTFFPTIKRSLNRESVLAIALNTGNDGNMQRLLDGEGWTPAQLKPVLDSMSREDWHVVQDIWDYFETYRPQIGAKQKRIYGTEPNWVEPAPRDIKLADGSTLALRGGYYPIKYDPAASVRAEEHADAEGAKRQLKGAYGAATTNRSFTKQRAEEVKDRPLIYTLSGLYIGVNDVIHDLAWHEWLIDINRLLKSDAIDSAMREHYGPEAVRQFKSWRDDIAEGDSASQAALDGALSRLRQGVSVAGLGFNVMSALMQPLGITQSIVRVGAKHIGRGVLAYIGNPVATTADVQSRSEFMAARARTRFRELNELRNSVQKGESARDKVGQYAYFLMMQCQQMVDVPTWLGAYDKAISEGNDDDRSKALADQAVIDAQGGGATKDLSAIERGSPAQKLFTVFYSFMNTALNLGVGSAATPKSRAKVAADMLLLYTVPAVLGAALKDALTPGDSGDWDDRKKLIRKLIGEQLTFLLGLMVVAREFGETGKALFGLSDHPRDYQGPAGLRVITDSLQAGKQIQQGEFDDSLRKSLINVGGSLMGLPAAQINRTVTGAKALKEGKTHNPAALLMGYQEPH